MLDTSTVILLGRIENPADLPDESVVSAVTLAELSVGPHVARTAKERVDGRSAGSRRRSGQPVGSRPLVRMTR